jgi:hypothetical protein
MAFGRKKLSPKEKLASLRGEHEHVYSRYFDGKYRTGSINKRVMKKLENRYLYVVKEALKSKEPLLKAGLAPHQYNYLVSAVTLPVVAEFVSRNPAAALEFTKEFGVERTAELMNSMNKGINIEKALEKNKPLGSNNLREIISAIGASDTVMLMDKIGAENFKLLVARIGPDGLVKLLRETGFKFNRQRMDFLSSKMAFVKKALIEKWSAEEIADQLHNEAVSQRLAARKRG